MNRKEIRIKCLELAVDYMNHLKQHQDAYHTEENVIIKIAEKFENYITKEEKDNEKVQNYKVGVE